MSSARAIKLGHTRKDIREIYACLFYKTRNTTFAVTHEARVKIFFSHYHSFLSSAKTYEKRAFSKCYTILRTRLQLMWIESVLGNDIYFIKATNALPCPHPIQKLNSLYTTRCVLNGRNTERHSGVDYVVILVQLICVAKV